MKRELLILVIVVVVIIVFVLFSRRSQQNSDDKHLVVSLSQTKSETIPTFLRHDDRPIVTASRIAPTADIPSSFDARERWPSLITPVLDQGACGSCWAFGTSSVLSDRTKISKGTSSLQANDYISPYALAACMKCPHQINTLCKSVCTGNYVDDVFNYLKSNGAFSLGQISASNGDGTQYICFRPSRGHTLTPFKATSVFRVNPYGPAELTSEAKFITNCRTVMDEIARNGPITATIKIFDPTTAGRRHQNFYLYSDGVYGTNWNSDPRESDGYHLINVIGFGSELVDGVQTDYWIIRNSWGTAWGMNGYGKVIRGKNRAIIESDMWTCIV